MKAGFFVFGMLVCVVGDDVKKTVKAGDSLTLNTNITKRPTEPMLWYFNNTRIGLINGEASTSCLYDGEGGRFRDRLEVDYETGSLTITHITAEHTGVYEAEIIRNKSEGTSQSLNRTSKCDRTKANPKTNNTMGETIKRYFVSVSGAKTNKSNKEEQQVSAKNSGLSAGAVAGICVAGLLIAAAVGFVIYHYWKRAKRGVFGDSGGLKSVTEGDSVTLNSGFTELMDDDLILWKFGSENTIIVQINVMANSITVYEDVLDGRFRHRLKVDHQTASLTITNTRPEHAGDYKLHTNSLSKSFSITVYTHLPPPAIDRDCSASFSQCLVLCSVVNVSAVSLSWYKGNSVLSSISVSDLSISLSLPLEVEYQDKNTYSCVINNTISNQTTHLDINTHCQTCPDFLLFCIVLICAATSAVLLIVAVICACKKCRTTAVTHEEDGNPSAWRKPKTKSKKDPMYENVPKK